MLAQSGRARTLLAPQHSFSSDFGRLSETRAAVTALLPLPGSRAVRCRFVVGTGALR